MTKRRQATTGDKVHGCILVVLAMSILLVVWLAVLAGWLAVGAPL